MYKDTRDTDSDNKLKQNLLCCFCFGRKKSSRSSTTFGSPEKNEPYEYVVEKLAIKKVPLRLFATDEDLEKHSKTTSSNSTATISQSSTKPPKREPINESNLEEKASSVTFSNYYQSIPPTNLEKQSHSLILPQHENASSTSLNYDQLNTSISNEQESSSINYEQGGTTLNSEQDKDVICNLAFKQRVLPKKIMTEDDERELVSNILYKHSSLFTLDPKEPVPKDPRTFRRQKVVVPPYVEEAIRSNKQMQFPPIHGRRLIEVDVHRASLQHGNPILNSTTSPEALPPMKSPAVIPPSKRELTPELKETINALGFAQRPHIPGLPPKNQRSIREGGTISDGSTEKELCCSVLAGEEVLDGTSSHELNCHILEQNEKRINSRRNPRRIIQESSCDESDDDNTFGSSTSNSKLLYPEGNVLRLSKNFTVQQQLGEQTDDRTLVEPSQIYNQDRITPIYSVNEAVGTSEPQMHDSEQITEISQLKGQSLKWKIIIKHHSDTADKELNEITSKSDDSEIESERPYLLRSRSPSPEEQH